MGTERGGQIKVARINRSGIITVALIGALCGSGAIAYRWVNSKSQKTTGPESPAITTEGQGSPVATTYGANSPVTQSVAVTSVVQNGSNNIGVNNGAVNIGVTDRTTELIVKGLEAEQKANLDLLDRIFPDGYTIFTATKGEEIVHLDHTKRVAIEFTWQGCSIALSNDFIWVTPPGMNFLREDGPCHMWANTYNVPVQIGSFLPRMVGPINGEVQRLYVLSTNEGQIRIAFGMSDLTPEEKLGYARKTRESFLFRTGKWE